METDYVGWQGLEVMLFIYLIFFLYIDCFGSYSLQGKVELLFKSSCN